MTHVDDDQAYVKYLTDLHNAGYVLNPEQAEFLIRNTDDITSLIKHIAYNY